MSKRPPDPNRPRRWQAILRRIPNDMTWAGAEVGVWMGRTSKELLAARPYLTLYMVDAWKQPAPNSTYAQSPDTIAKQGQGYFDSCFEKACREVRQFGERAQIMRMWSSQATFGFLDGSLDFVFIDAEHTYEGVKRDTLLWLPKVKPGGWLGWHDVGNLPRFPGVELAIDELIGLDNIERDGDCTGFYRITE